MSRSIKQHRPRVFVFSVIAAALVGLSLCSTADAQAVNSFKGITSWVGAGPNSAAMVIDWNDGSSGGGDISLVWGYHWTGAATGEQMLDAIVAADPHLYLYILQTEGFGDAPAGIGYHASGDGNFPLSPALAFSDRIATTSDEHSVDSSRSAVNLGDQWEEGWLTGGFWNYWISTNALVSSSFTNWNFSDSGITGQSLADGDWNALTFAPDFNSSTPAEPTPAAVPEPAGITLLFLGALCLLRRRNRLDRPASA